MMKASAVIASVLCLLILEVCGTNAVEINLGLYLDAQLDINFYSQRCSLAETIVKNITWNRVAADSKLSAKLIRMHFHDCFIRGCDGSVLLDSADNTTEKAARANQFLTGFDVIDEIKKELEDKCPGVVSCADIVAMAARDAVSYPFQKPMWEVPLGRKDGRVSNVSEVSLNLPSPFSNFTTLLENFQSHCLDIYDLVVLSGAHTLGETHCSLLERRLYNFTGNNDTDPELNSEYAETLKAICPNPINPDTPLDMDPGSATAFDTHYFTVVKQKMGIFQSDAALMEDPFSALLVEQLQDPQLFFSLFAKSMKKLGSITALKDGEGEIRKSCGVVNS